MDTPYGKFRVNRQEDPVKYDPVAAHAAVYIDQPASCEPGPSTQPRPRQPLAALEEHVFYDSEDEDTPVPGAWQKAKLPSMPADYYQSSEGEGGGESPAYEYYSTNSQMPSGEEDYEWYSEYNRSN